MLALCDVCFGYPGARQVLGPVSVEIGAGQAWGLVGPNGAGKSTLLRLMAGLLRPARGAVRLDDQPLGALPRRTRAQRIAFLPQHLPYDLDLSVREVVLLGRFPHRSLGVFESAEDHQVAESAMERTDTLPFADRPLRTLSGGEAQRVHLAAALAQEPSLLLLDEPTASLDLGHQLAVLRLLRGRIAGDGLATVAVTHDVNLVAPFSTHVLLLHHGRVEAAGEPRQVLTPETVERVYGVAVLALSSGARPDRRWLVPAAEFGEPA
ncbi:MAG: ABC transporter ATP-binding protein [Planctomycetes bacterium]|nr:ABC transporter ATP-binding protein [Planctomycetota bacterium]